MNAFPAMQIARYNQHCLWMCDELFMYVNGTERSIEHGDEREAGKWLLTEGWSAVINSHLLTNTPAIVLDTNAISSPKLIVMIALSPFETKQGCSRRR